MIFYIYNKDRVQSSKQNQILARCFWYLLTLWRHQVEQSVGCYLQQGEESHHYCLCQHLLDGTASIYRGCEGSQLKQLGSTFGKVRWSSLAWSSRNCVVYPHLSGVTLVLLSILYDFKMFTFKFDVFLVWYQDFLLCRISCSGMNETPKWIFASQHQYVVLSFNICDLRITWSSSHCVLLNLLV